MKLMPLMLLPLLVVGCSDITASDSLTEVNDVSFPAPPAAAAGIVVSTDQIVPLDISSPVNELQKHGTLSLNVEENSLQGDISFIRHITLDLTTADLPDLVLVDTDVNSTASYNNFPLLVSGDAMLPYLANPCGLHFTISGSIPAEGVSLSSKIVMSVSEEVKGL
jgi:hypothetical protein